MAILIVVALLIPAALALAGWLSWIAVAIVDILILFVAAWGIDRRRRPGARDPYLDANRSDFPTTGPGAAIVPPPAEAFQSPSDRGVPD